MSENVLFGCDLGRDQSASAELGCGSPERGEKLVLKEEKSCFCVLGTLLWMGDSVSISFWYLLFCF